MGELLKPDPRELSLWASGPQEQIRLRAEVEALRAEGAALRVFVLALAERVHAQSELPSRRAERKSHA